MEETHQGDLQGADLRFLEVEPVDGRDHLQDLMEDGTGEHHTFQTFIHPDYRVREECELTEETLRHLLSNHRNTVDAIGDLHRSSALLAILPPRHDLEVSWVVVSRVAVTVVDLLTVSLPGCPLLDHQASSLVPRGAVLPLLGLAVVLSVFLLVVAGFFAGHGSPSFA